MRIYQIVLAKLVSQNPVREFAPFSSDKKYLENVYEQTAFLTESFFVNSSISGGQALYQAISYDFGIDSVDEEKLELIQKDLEMMVNLKDDIKQGF